MSVIPPAVLQLGASHCQSARGVDSFIPALSTVYVSPPRIAIAEGEGVSGYSEILQLYVLGDGTIIGILQCRYQIFKKERVEYKPSIGNLEWSSEPSIQEW